MHASQPLSDHATTLLGTKFCSPKKMLEWARVILQSLYALSCLQNAISTHSFCGFWHGHSYIPRLFWKCFLYLYLYYICVTLLMGVFTCNSLSMLKWVPVWFRDLKGRICTFLRRGNCPWCPLSLPPLMPVPTNLNMNTLPIQGTLPKCGETRFVCAWIGSGLGEMWSAWESASTVCCFNKRKMNNLLPHF